MLNPFELEYRRREFLKAAGGLTVLAAAARMGVIGCAPAERPAGAGSYRALTTEEIALLTALWPHFVPQRGDHPPLPTTDRADDWLAVVDKVLASTDPHFRRLFRVLCAIFENASVFSLRFTRFTHLDRGDQAAIVREWSESHSALKSSGFQLFRTLIFLGVYSQPGVYQALGYNMPCGPAPRPRPDGLRTGDDIDGHVVLSADAVVVGSGAGGAMVAAKLAEAGRKVVLLESGSYYDASHFTGTVPEIWSKTYAQQGFALMEGEPPIVLFYGDSVGGTTTINLGTCYRTPAAVLERWAREEGLSGLSADSMAPFFEETERAIHAEETSWNVIGERERVLHDGAAKLGWKHRRLMRNTLGCVGCGRCLLGCPVNAKQSTLVSLVPRAGAAGASIYSDAKVDRVLLDHGHAVGVEASVRDPSTRQPKAKITVNSRTVVLAAGTVGTPLILLRSGLENEHTGQHMRIHPASGCLGVFPKRLNDRLGAPQAWGAEEFAGEGMMLESFFGPPDLFAGLASGYGRAHNELLSQYPHVSVPIFFLAERGSAGTVKQGLGGATAMTYSLTDEDAGRAVEGFRRVAQLLFASGAERVLIPLQRMFEAKTESDVNEILAREAGRENLHLYGFHPMGTARMGIDSSRSVVGPFGEHHRAQGLYVADGSIFPTALGVNPQVSIMSFAARTAQHLLESRS